MKRLFTLLLCALVLCSTSAFGAGETENTGNTERTEESKNTEKAGETEVADEIEKETYTFAIKESDTLRLDLFRANSQEPAPCVMFVFGGAFLMGERDNEAHKPFFEYLHQKGYTVVAIDYRLGLSKLTKKESKGLKLVKKFKWSVDIAVEDLFDATNFVLEHAEEWNINPNMIITSGSSAGAITVVQGEYEICNSSKLASVLPEGFNYAGVMSFAGAIMKMGGKPKWPKEPCPIIFFHGDADNFVPYNKVSVPLIAGFYGSNYLVNQLSKTEAPYYFYQVENVDHAMASLPLKENRRQLDYFLENYVQLGEKLQITEHFKDLTLPEKPKKFKLKDIAGSSMQYANPQ